jgi:hypothetical protein
MKNVRQLYRANYEYRDPGIMNIQEKLHHAYQTILCKAEEIWKTELKKFRVFVSSCLKY